LVDRLELLMSNFTYGWLTPEKCHDLHPGVALHMRRGDGRLTLLEEEGVIVYGPAANAQEKALEKEADPAG